MSIGTHAHTQATNKTKRPRRTRYHLASIKCMTSTDLHSSQPRHTPQTHTHHNGRHTPTTMTNGIDFRHAVEFSRNRRTSIQAITTRPEATSLPYPTTPTQSNPKTTRTQPDRDGLPAPHRSGAEAHRRLCTGCAARRDQPTSRARRPFLPLGATTTTLRRGPWPGQISRP